MNPFEVQMTFIVLPVSLSTQRWLTSELVLGCAEMSRGVGCGYIVKVDLSKDLLDETGEENAMIRTIQNLMMKHYRKKYMNVWPPVRGKK